MPTSAEKSTRTNKSSKRLGRFTRTKMDSRNFRKKKVSGLFPEHGAIFMSNRNTLKECFERSLFGLPDSFSSFVKNVKAGMILFLFQFEDRKLYGVYKAVSDGGMNIVPRAYASSGKQFPAQVKFTSILRCDPLFENEFSDVIRYNYFTPMKFNFGLSKDQVQSLMWLFESRKREVPRSLHQKKRKSRKSDFQVVEDLLMKESVTNEREEVPRSLHQKKRKNRRWDFQVVEDVLRKESVTNEREEVPRSPHQKKRKNRKWDFQVVEDVLMKESVTNEREEVPHSLHQKKRKNRKWDFQIVEDVLMKESVANTRKRKLNTPGTSVTAEQEPDELTLSTESCGKCENIHLIDDAYDPENPGFNYPVGSGAHSAASYESHELPTLQKKKGDSDILEEDTENFIPLCSTDNSDLEDGEIDNFSECSEEKQIELDVLVGNDVFSIPVPRFLLSNEEYNKIDDSSSVAVSDSQSKDESDNLNSLLSKGLYSDEPKTRTREKHIELDMLVGNDVFSIPVPRFLPSNEEYNKIDDPSSVAVSDLQSKDESDNLNSLLSKGLYSDEPKTRTSVFSRLSFSSKGIASKNQTDANGKDLSRAKHQYQYEQREEITQQSDGTMCKRASVFRRLTGASDDVAPQIHFIAGLNEQTSG